MDSTRQNKVGRLLQKELSMIFQKRSSSFLGTMVSVTEVRVAQDMSTARVFVSIFPTDKKDEVFLLVQANTKAIRHELAQIVKNQLRKAPQLIFEMDESLDYAAKIDELLK